MCGISGYFLTNKKEQSSEKILRMTRAVSHRGPDDEGIVLISPESALAIDLRTSQTDTAVTVQKSVDNAGIVPHRIAFGHRRFSIIDLSSAGHQPFWTDKREVCVSANGEIYNYLELREELKSLGHVFNSNSDTEVLVKSYLEWGTECFNRFNGFWALSLYDSRKKAILLARDRIGKAPLYVFRNHEGLWWSSDIKGIFASLGSSGFSVRNQAVLDYVVYGWRDVFHKTFYEGLTTFPNAAYAWVNKDGSYDPVNYWKIPTNRMSEKNISIDDATSKLRTLLTEAIKIRQRSDVPVGFAFSGGLDSSSIVGVATQTATEINAFTVSFRGTSADEEWYARKVVEKYSDKINITVLDPPREEFFDQVDSFFRLIEEPFHSPLLLTEKGIFQKMADHSIRVSLDGGGGDELLAGYPSHYYIPYLRYLLRQGSIARFIKEFLLFSERAPGDNLNRLRRVFVEPLNPPPAIPASIDPFIRPNDTEDLSGPSSEINQRLIDNMGNWLMNYWMRAGSKEVMGIPVEPRLPFLDHRLVDFAFILPLGYLIRNGWHKWILRESVKDILPPEVVWRKHKFGFPFPLDEWLRASEVKFLEMLQDLECPYVNIPKIKTAYKELNDHHPHYLWRLLCLALWWKKCVLGDDLV